MVVFIVVLVILALLVLVLLIGALRVKPTPIADPLPPSQAMGSEESVARFQEMLRLPTVWAAEDPDANHTPFDRFVPRMRELYPVVFGELELTMVNTYGIMLRWKGSDPDLAPVVLMAHHDVVVADPEGWTHDPFAAEIADGRIWARGAVDTKCILGCLYEATETLLAEGYVPPCDVYLCSSNCEEDSGDTTPKMVEYFEERGIVPYLVLDEGGAIIDDAPLGVDRQFACIGVAEKGFFNGFVTTESKGGHASTPSTQDATGRLVTGLNAMQDDPAPASLSAPVATMLRELAAHGSFMLRIVFGNLWLFRPLVLAIMKKDHETAAMVRTTYAITELEGSRAANVIPKRAHAAVNCRIDPSETFATASARLENRFAAGTEFEYRDVDEPSPISPFDGPAFEYLRRITRSVYPEAGIAPYVQSSCSDARHMHRICPNVYRFAGILFKGDQRSRIHGQDENLDVESYRRGVGFYEEFIRHLDLLGR